MKAAWILARESDLTPELARRARVRVVSGRTPQHSRWGATIEIIRNVPMWMSKLNPPRREDPVRSAVAIDALLDELRDGLRHVEVARRTQSEPTAARARARSEAVLRSARERLERDAPLMGPGPYARAAIGIQALGDALKALDSSRPAIRM